MVSVLDCNYVQLFLLKRSGAETVYSALLHHAGQVSVFFYTIKFQALVLLMM